MHSTSDLLPIAWAQEIIGSVENQSALMALSTKRRLSTRVTRMPVLSALAAAYWVGDNTNDFTGLKQTTKAEWQGVTLNVEDLAVLVPIPDAYAQDSGFPVWENTRPLVEAAISEAIDAAGIWGVNKPSTWPAAIVPGIPAGLVVDPDDFTDLPQAAAEAAKLLARKGYNPNGFVAAPGFSWELVGSRTEAGLPIYQPDLQNGTTGKLYGRPILEAVNGTWDDDEGQLLVGDWTKSVVGIRQDITFTKHDSGVISDADGAVVFNAMQQDATIWRAVIRLAWAKANPVNQLSRTYADATRYPWAMVGPTDGS
jgi:HK97 family phage major capsid protein